MNVEIRPYQLTDREACRALWAELTIHHREIYEDPTIGGEQPGLYFDTQLSRIGSNRLWVADAGGRVCGLVGLIVGEQEEQEAEIDPLIVSASQRGKGVGLQLLNRARDEAEALHVRFLSVRAVARNVTAIDFYYRAGFRLLGNVELFMELTSPSDRSWKEGIILHGHLLGY